MASAHRMGRTASHEGAAQPATPVPLRSRRLPAVGSRQRAFLATTPGPAQNGSIRVAWPNIPLYTVCGPYGRRASTRFWGPRHAWAKAVDVAAVQRTGAGAGRVAPAIVAASPGVRSAQSTNRPRRARTGRFHPPKSHDRQRGPSSKARGRDRPGVPPLRLPGYLRGEATKAACAAASRAIGTRYGLQLT